MGRSAKPECARYRQRGDGDKTPKCLVPAEGAHKYLRERHDDDLSDGAERRADGQSPGTGCARVGPGTRRTAP